MIHFPPEFVKLREEFYLVFAFSLPLYIVNIMQIPVIYFYFPGN